MGYQVGVTPLQMAAAVSSVANGGTLYRAARRARGHQGRRRARGRAQGRCGARLAETAATLTDDHGSRSSSAAPRQAAQIAGYTIAGKTGTAAKLVNGRYSKSDYNASFVGFVPVAQPGADDHRRDRLAAR